MDDKQQAEWDRFYSGKWQREMPEVVGLYPIATRQGEHAGTTHIVWNPKEEAYFTPQFMRTKKGELLTPVYNGTSWGGYWWSEPLPDRFLLTPPPGES